MKAFASGVTRKFDTIKLLSELRLSNNGDPYAYIGQMRTLIDSFRILDIDIDTVIYGMA